MIKKEFIPYELALDLKKLAFDETFDILGQGLYYRNRYLCQANSEALDYFKSQNDEVISAPLYQQAFRFFREKYNLKYKFEPSKENTVDIFIWCIVGWQYFKNTIEKEAELICLQKLIQIANERTNRTTI